MGSVEVVIDMYEGIVAICDTYERAERIFRDYVECAYDGNEEHVRIVTWPMNELHRW